MMPDIIRTTSIKQLHENLGLGKPLHPLITIIDTAKMAYGEELIGTKFTSDLYCIALKDKSCGLDYGRNHYDFDEGTLIFIGPDQVFSVRKAQGLNEVQGWMLYFHPDLIRGTSLGEKIDDYTFFSYDVHEALHLSEQEEGTITQCIEMIRMELNERIDNHSQTVLISTIELMLNHSKRYYERQFNTRSNGSKGTVSKVEFLLKEYFKSDKVSDLGLPTIQYLAEKCNVSTYYLSDLLKKETGRTAKDHINDYIIDKAKNMLLASSESINEIAYTLGFNYPHYFSRLFKSKTGLTPQDYRKN
jgi:AraC-like DNA-binding protein